MITFHSFVFVVHAAEEEITDADIEELDIPELKKMCRDLNLSAEGGVNTLRGRLISHLFHKKRGRK